MDDYCLNQRLDAIIKNQEKQLEILDKLLSLFLQYDRSYNEEMLKDHKVE